MKNLIILYIVISYPIVLGYTIASVNYEELKWSDVNDKLSAVFIVLFSPIILLVLLGSLLFKRVKE